MIRQLKLPFQFDAEQLQTDLRLLEQEQWIDHFVQQNYLGAWRVMPLRCPTGATHPVMMAYSAPDCQHWTNTPFLDKCRYTQSILNSFRCPLQSVRLMRLTAGSLIKPHQDHDLAFEEGQVRLHIPITTNPDTHFRLNQQKIFMDVGECWYLRFADEHSVQNNGQTDRVHLVIDATVNDWLTGFFLSNQSTKRINHASIETS